MFTLLLCPIKVDFIRRLEKILQPICKNKIAMSNIKSIDNEEVPFYSLDINKFAESIIWFQSAECILKNQNTFLLYILRAPETIAYNHAKKYFGYTDDDFRQALYNAEPGIIMYEHIWELWNKRLNINPALPFPKRKFFAE